MKKICIFGQLNAHQNGHSELVKLVSSSWRRQAMMCVRQSMIICHLFSYIRGNYRPKLMTLSSLLVTKRVKEVSWRSFSWRRAREKPAIALSQTSLLNRQLMSFSCVSFLVITSVSCVSSSGFVLGHQLLPKRRHQFVSFAGRQLQASGSFRWLQGMLWISIKKMTASSVEEMPPMRLREEFRFQLAHHRNWAVRSMSYLIYILDD